jgi:hypothetical protein
MQRIIRIVPVYIFFLLISICPATGLICTDAAQPGSVTYFSSGQAVCDQQDQQKSRQQALQDFMVRGVTQAVGSFMSPSQMGSRFAELQKKVLGEPEKYVDSYQIFSEDQAGGMFRINGQVSVAVDTLKKDLEEKGLSAVRQEPSTPPAASKEPAHTAAESEEENLQNVKDIEPSDEADESDDPTPQPALANNLGGEKEQSAGTPSRGIASTRKEILWAVAEKWEQEWVLPTDAGDVRSLFAQNLGREMDNFDFSLLLTQPGTVRMDLAGNIPPSQVIALAEGLGIQEVVVGKVSYNEARDGGQVRLEASLRLIRIGQGKSEFEISKAQGMEDLSNQEGAAELARRVAPQLSSLLGGPQTARATGPVATDSQASASQTAGAGTLLVHVPSEQYSSWMELEGLLREQFKGMKRTGLEIGSAQSTIKLVGVSPGEILKMSGAKLPGGAAIKIDSYSTETGTMTISFASPEKVQGESK